jgi:hypothetical protein
MAARLSFPGRVNNILRKGNELQGDLTGASAPGPNAEYFFTTNNLENYER